MLTRAAIERFGGHTDGPVAVVLFGAEDRDPSPADVDAIDAALTRAGVTHECHRLRRALA